MNSFLYEEKRQELGAIKAALLNLCFNHMHHVRGTTDTDLTAVNANDRVSFLQIDFRLLLQKLIDVRPYDLMMGHGIRGVHARNNLWEQTTLQTALSGNLLIGSDHNHRSSWVICGNTARSSASVAECDDKFALKIQRSLHSRRAHAFLNG